MTRLEARAREWLATLEDIASGVEPDVESTHLSQFEQNMLEQLRALLGDPS